MGATWDPPMQYSRLGTSKAGARNIQKQWCLNPILQAFCHNTILATTKQLKEWFSCLSFKFWSLLSRVRAVLLRWRLKLSRPCRKGPFELIYTATPGHVCCQQARSCCILSCQQIWRWIFTHLIGHGRSGFGSRLVSAEARADEAGSGTAAPLWSLAATCPL